MVHATTENCCVLKIITQKYQPSPFSSTCKNGNHCVSNRGAKRPFGLNLVFAQNSQIQKKVQNPSSRTGLTSCLGCDKLQEKHQAACTSHEANG